MRDSSAGLSSTRRRRLTPIRAPLLPRRVRLWVTWALTLVVLGGSLWLAGRVLGAVANVAVPLAVTMLFVALLHPLDRLLRKIMPRGFAAVLTVVAMLAALAGARRGRPAGRSADRWPVEPVGHRLLPVLLVGGRPDPAGCHCLWTST